MGDDVSVLSPRSTVLVTGQVRTHTDKYCINVLHELYGGHMVPLGQACLDDRENTALKKIMNKPVQNDFFFTFTVQYTF